ncbi:MAG: SGNH/GDSL hydrolase family protein [Alphaproteobacteria bacterium]|nr:SGNH/GDSL hydrolase family protein [Alphaproteobacteria bacterium]
MKFIASSLLILASTLIAVGLSEIGYRLILQSEVPERFAYADAGQVEVFDQSHWLFDQETGYAYPPGRKIAHTAIREGKVVSCTLIDVINERGNIGPIEGDYANADLKIAVFGDSWSAFSQNGLTWTDILQRKLSEHTDRSVHVLNFGRDGYGILQMFDLAARELPVWNPDIAVFAFITNDLARVRTWRAIIERNGTHDRILTTFRADPNPASLEGTYDTFLVHADATHEWCLEARKAGVRDEVVRAVEAKYQRARRVGGERPADLFATNLSYLWNRVRHGDPFHGVPDRFDFPTLEIAGYNEDERFVQALNKIRSHSSEKLLFHMAIYPEVKEQTEYILNFNEESLLRSLLELTRFPVIETLENTETPVENPERMNSAPDNYHPSIWGMELYADALIEGLERGGFLESIPN